MDNIHTFTLNQYSLTIESNNDIIKINIKDNKELDNYNEIINEKNITNIATFLTTIDETYKYIIDTLNKQNNDVICITPESGKLCLNITMLVCGNKKLNIFKLLLVKEDVTIGENRDIELAKLKAEIIKLNMKLDQYAGMSNVFFPYQTEHEQLNLVFNGNARRINKRKSTQHGYNNDSSYSPMEADVCSSIKYGDDMQNVKFSKIIQIQQHGWSNTVAGSYFQIMAKKLGVGLKGKIYKMIIRIKSENIYDPETPNFGINVKFDLCGTGENDQHSNNVHFQQRCAYFDNPNCNYNIKISYLNKNYEDKHFNNYLLKDCTIYLFIDTKNYRYAYCYDNIPEMLEWSKMLNISNNNESKFPNIEQHILDNYNEYYKKIYPQNSVGLFGTCEPTMSMMLRMPFEGEITLN